MNTQQTRPVITPAMREQAAKQPNTWLYVVDPIFTDPTAEIPPWGFIGGYRVDERGELTDDFSSNPNYRPSPVALRLPAPNNDLERALQLTTTGYAQGQALLTALLDAEIILFAQPQGSGLFTMEHESGRRQLQVFTSDGYLPPNWTTWQRMTGWQLANHQPNGLDLQINPTSPVKARIPGEDLVRAAGMALRAAESRNTLSPAAGTPVEVSTEDSSTFTPVPPQALATTPAPPAPAEANQPFKQSGKPPAGSAAKQGQPKQGQAKQAPPGTKPPEPTDTDLGQRLLGAVLSGAAADALGSTVEFYPLDQIRSRYGGRGVVDYDRSSDRPGEFTDDTQMTLFTLEGLVRGHIAVRRGVAENPMPALQLAYQRWLHTQGYAWTRAVGPFADEHPEPTGWLIGREDLFSVRSPSSSCITALRGFATSGHPAGFASDGAQDASGLVRAAPVALWSDSPKQVFELAAATATLTCPHPNGYLPAGVHAVLIQRLIRGEPLREALRRARELLAGYAGHEPTDQSLAAAIELAREGVPTGERLKETLGGGWNGHEALAIAVCAALSTESVASAVIAAVNHSGDSDTTGAVCGTIVGARYGSTAVPGAWLQDLRQRETLESAVRDALREFTGQPSDDPSFLERYPAEHDRSELPFATFPPAVGNQPAPVPAEPARKSADGEPAESDSAETPESADESAGTSAAESTEDTSDSTGSPEPEDPKQAAAEQGAPELTAAEQGAAEREAAAHEGTEQEAAEQEVAAHEESGQASGFPATDTAEPSTTDTKSADDEETTGPAPASNAPSASNAGAGIATVAAGAAAVAAGTAAASASEDSPSEDAASGDSADSPSENPEPANSEPANSEATRGAPATTAARGVLTDDRTTRINGCMLGGAVGDALGQPVAEESLPEIREAHGNSGVRDLVDGRFQAGSLSDCTQMSLFTLEGLVRAGRSRRLHDAPELSRHVQLAYQRWLHTQGVDWAEAGGPEGGNAPDGWLIQQDSLFARRSPGDTCLRALQQHAGGEPVASFQHRLNDSKGSGGVVRAAPAGLWSDDPTEVFRIGATTAVLTHGHPSGFLPAGALAVIVQQLVAGHSLPNAVDRALTEMSAWGGHEETLIGLRGAIELAATGDPTPEQITEQLGTGELGEQVLAIAVCAALSHPQSFTDAVLLAANHSGRTHSTAAVCGNIMGAAQGASAVPVRWRDKLELRETIEALVRDAAVEFGPQPTEDPELARRYPLSGPARSANTGGGGDTTEPTYDTSGTVASKIEAIESEASGSASEVEAPEITAAGAREQAPEQPTKQSTSGDPESGEPTYEEHAVDEPTNREPATHKLVYRGAVTEPADADTAEASDHATTTSAMPPQPAPVQPTPASPASESPAAETPAAGSSIAGSSVYGTPVSEVPASESPASGAAFPEAETEHATPENAETEDTGNAAFVAGAGAAGIAAAGIAGAAGAFSAHTTAGHTPDGDTTGGDTTGGDTTSGAGNESMAMPAPPAQQPESQPSAAQQTQSTPQEPVWESVQTPVPRAERSPTGTQTAQTAETQTAGTPTTGTSATDTSGTETPPTGIPATETLAAQTPAGTPEIGALATGTSESPAESGPESFEETDEPDDLLSDEELRLLAAWRKFRDGENDTPTDLSQGLRKLLAEAFGEERAAQLVGDAQPEQTGELAAESTEQLGREERLAGCVLGAAVGDALAAPWIFADLATIMHNNPDGVREYSEVFGRNGAVTALGQQSAFLLDGLLRAMIRSRHDGVGGQVPSMVRLSLQHWVCTQGARIDPALPVGLLSESSTLRAQRFPDETSLVSLSRDPQGQTPTPSDPPNCASTATATVRGGAVGFHADNPQTALSLGAEVGVLTHGHPDGYLPAGALASMIASIQDGQTVSDAVQRALSHLEVFEGSDTTAQKLRSAVEFAAQGPVSPALLEELGAGWEAPEALAIAVAAALSHPNELPEAVSLAATHSGNSAATAAICGSLLGAARGVRALPQEWLDELETREVLQQMLADDARVDAEIHGGEPVPDWANRYLG